MPRSASLFFAQILALCTPSCVDHHQPHKPPRGLRYRLSWCDANTLGRLSKRCTWVETAHTSSRQHVPRAGLDMIPQPRPPPDPTVCMLAAGGSVRVDGWSRVREERGFHVQFDAGELSRLRERERDRAHIEKGHAQRKSTDGPADAKKQSHANGFGIMHATTIMQQITTMRQALCQNTG